MHVISGTDASSADSRFRRFRRLWTLGGIVLVGPTTAKQRPRARVMCGWREVCAREWCARGKWMLERDCACAWEYESLFAQPGSSTEKVPV